MPASIQDMLDIPKDEAVKKYIQNYSLNLIRLRDFTNEQAEKFKSDFVCIAKFLSKSYNKAEQIKALQEDKQKLIHTRDTLYTLASITNDKRYLDVKEANKEGAAVCEVAEALVQMGKEQGIEQGIKSVIEACKEFNIKKDDILLKISEKFNLDAQKAQYYMDKYWQ